MLREIVVCGFRRGMWEPLGVILKNELKNESQREENEEERKSGKGK